MRDSKDCYLCSTCQKFLRGDCNKSDFCIKLFKLDSLFDLAFLSDTQRMYTPLRTDSNGTDKQEFLRLKDIEKSIVDFVSSGKNLYLHSSVCGNGKTSWALRLMQSYLKSIWIESDIACRAMFISVPKFFIMLKDNISKQNEYIQHIKENYESCDLIIWDDIGTKVGTEFEVEHLLNIINNRIDNGKSNIYTSNMTPQQLQERVGERLYSRIVNMSENIELHGMDKRGL